MILVGGTIDDAATLALYDLACGLVEQRRVSPVDGDPVLRLLDDGALDSRRRDRDREDPRAPVVVDPAREPRHAGVPARSSRRVDRALLRRRHPPDPRLREGPDHRRPRAGSAATTSCSRAPMPVARSGSSRSRTTSASQAAFVYKRRVSGSETHVTGVSRAGRRQARRDLRRHDPHRRLADQRGAGVPRCRRGRDRRDRDARPVSRRFARSNPSDRPVRPGRHDRQPPRAVALRSEYLHVESTAHLLAEHLRSNR